MRGSELPQAEECTPRVWPVSIPAYHALGELGLIPEKTELLYGQVIHDMPKSPLHGLLALRLLRRVQEVLPQDRHVRVELPIVCSDSEPEPDLSIVRGSMEDYGTKHPRTADLVIEVCVTSHEYDRSKLRAYASAKVKECWLVLGPEKQIEVHHNPTAQRFAEHALYGPGGVITSVAIPQVTVDLAALFAA